MRILLIVSAILVLLILAGTVLCYFTIKIISANKCYDELHLLPQKEYALVLGTAKWVHHRHINLYYRYRLLAAANLYKAGKVHKLLVSGAAIPGKFNQALEMRNTLMEKGIPAADIIMDEAGYRTLDSVIRCREVFHQNDVIIVSQRFHNERAVFTGLFKKMDVVAYNAHDVKGRAHIKMIVREYLARVKCMLDLLVLNKQPARMEP